MEPPRHVVPDDAAGSRLVDHAREHLAVVAAKAVGPLIADGRLLVDGRPGRIAEPLRAGAVLTVAHGSIAALVASERAIVPEALAVPVLWEDDDLVVVAKPAGTHVHPMGPHRRGTLVGAMLWHAGARPDQPWARWRPYPAHRLDRATSGLMTFAKSRRMQDAFRRLLDDREVERTYHAWVDGEISEEGGTIDAPLGPDPDLDYRRAIVPVADGGQPAVSHWRVIGRTPGRSLVEVTLETGRTHQIRAHLASLGHPIVGDSLYAADDDPVAATSIELRAVRLAFPHPRDGRRLDLSLEQT